MNTIAKFRLCTLTDEELLRAVDAATDKMYKTGRIPDRQIPAWPDVDFDLIVGELICRFIESKNSLIEHRAKLRSLFRGVDVELTDPEFIGINETPDPNDHREQPFNDVEWYKPGMYFRNRYRNLNEGEIIELGDEVQVSAKYNDPPKWVPAGITVGQQAPNPHFMAHRVYRRQYFPKRTVNAV